MAGSWLWHTAGVCPATGLNTGRGIAHSPLVRWSHSDHLTTQKTEVTTRPPEHTQNVVMVKYGRDTPQKRPTCRRDHHGHVRAMNSPDSTLGLWGFQPECASEGGERAQEDNKHSCTGTYKGRVQWEYASHTPREHTRPRDTPSYRHQIQQLSS